MTTRPDGEPTTPEPPLGPVAAGVLVFGAAAAVLVVELVALRLVAPYLGLTLETSTLVIGVALAAIATGAWAGGRAADTTPPERAIGPLLAISGVVVAATPFAVRGAGEAAGSGGAMLVAMLAILVPGGLLSAVPPMVTKLRLTDLAETGTVVGRLSGTGTVGAIAGTVLTGFVFVAALPVSAVLVGLGVALVVAAVLVEYRVRGIRAAVLPALLLVPAALGAAFGPGRCDAETVYHCAVRRDRRVATDRAGPGPRRPVALVRRPRGPDPPGVRVRAGDGLGHRHRVRARRGARGVPPRGWRPDPPAVPRDGATGHELRRLRDRPRRRRARRAAARARHRPRPRGARRGRPPRAATPGHRQPRPRRGRRLRGDQRALAPHDARGARGRAPGRASRAGCTPRTSSTTGHSASRGPRSRRSARPSTTWRSPPTRSRWPGPRVPGATSSSWRRMRRSTCRPCAPPSPGGSSTGASSTARRSTPGSATPWCSPTTTRPSTSC